MSLAKYEFLLKATRSLCFSVDVSSEVVALSPRSYSHKWSDGLIHIDGDTVISYSFEPVGLQLVCSGDQLPMSKSLALACDVAYALASFQGEPVEVLSLEAPPDFDEDLPESQIVSINTLDLPPKIELFMRAMEHKDEMSFCDGCGTPIVFTPIGSGEDAIRHFCSCGRYVGTLRR